MMIEASLSSPLVVTEAKFLLEILVVSLDPPAQLGSVDEAQRLMFAGSVDRKYFVGSVSSASHSIRHHSLGLSLEQ